MEAASAVAQAVRSKVLLLGDFVARRKQSTKQPKKDYMGYVYSLPEHEQEALVEAGRLSVKELRGIDNAEHAALDAYHKVGCACARCVAEQNIAYTNVFVWNTGASQSK